MQFAPDLTQKLPQAIPRLTQGPQNDSQNVKSSISKKTITKPMSLSKPEAPLSLQEQLIEDKKNITFGDLPKTPTAHKTPTPQIKFSVQIAALENKRPPIFIEESLLFEKIDSLCELENKKSWDECELPKTSKKISAQIAELETHFKEPISLQEVFIERTTSFSDLIKKNEDEIIRPDQSGRTNHRPLKRHPNVLSFSDVNENYSKNYASQKHYLEQLPKSIGSMSRSEESSFSERREKYSTPKNSPRKLFAKKISEYKASVSDSSEASSSPIATKIGNFKNSDEKAEASVSDPFAYDCLKSSEEIAQFNDNLTKKLLEKSDTYRNGTKVLKNVESVLSDLCQRKVDSLFHEGHLTLDKFYPIRKNVTYELMGEISDHPSIISANALCLENLKENLISLKKNLISYVKISFCKTRLSVELNKTIDLLLNAKSSENTLEILKKIGKLENASETPRKLSPGYFIHKDDSDNAIIKKLIFDCIGRNSFEVDRVFKFLEKCADKKRLMPEIKETTTQMAEIADLTIQRHMWSQDPKLCPISLSIISPNDIYRSWKQEKRVGFNLVTVNGNTIYKAPLDILPKHEFISPQTPSDSAESSMEEEISDFDLYHLAFSSIYDAGFTKGSLTIETQVRKFLQIVAKNNLRTIPEDEEDTGIVPLRPEDEIPCLVPLKLTTVNCKLAGMDYFYCLFPELSPIPYGTNEVRFFNLKLIQGITCHIKILSKNSFTVTQHKKIDVCVSGNQLGLPDSTNVAVATLEILWKVGPNENLWEGYLGIVSCKIHLQEYHKKLMKILRNPVKNAHSTNLPNGVTFFPQYCHIFN